MKNYMKKNWSTILLLFIFTVGLSLLLYPTFSDWWNSIHATHAMDGYSEAVRTMSDDEYQAKLQEAYSYNEALLESPDRWHPSDTLHSQYENTLNLDTNGMIGILKIPSLRVELPIYHGTGEAVLSHAIGHLEGSTLPTGGEGMHTILSGHRGLPSAKLLSDLDQLEKGDYFMVTVLDDTYTYMVDQIQIVLPEDFTYLQTEEGKDLVTLVTCTPYGVNSHRLLVRGHRVDNLPDDYINTRNEASLISSNLVALFIAVVIFLLLFIRLMIRSYLSKKAKKARKIYENTEVKD